MINPATEALKEISKECKLSNRTKKALGPKSKEDFDMYDSETKQIANNRSEE